MFRPIAIRVRRPSTAASLLAAVVFAALAILPTAHAAQLGGRGHYVKYYPQVRLLNPDGRGFTIDLLVATGPIKEWIATEVPLVLTSPSGEKLVRTLSLDGGEGRLVVEEADAETGVYRLDLKMDAQGRRTGQGAYVIRTSLPRIVAHTGDPAGHIVEGRRLVVACPVPRRWTFWVPDDVTSFKVRAQRADRYMSQREDWGITVFNPRGQRVAVLWGQPPNTRPYRQEMIAEVEVEPGAGGRFWMIEIRHGDGHNYSDINVALEGVPPYLARSPEEYFNGDDGVIPQPLVYDDDAYMQFAGDEARKRRWPELQHFIPVPSVGDPDGNMVRGAARVAIRNPEGRAIRYRFGTYLPRDWQPVEMTEHAWTYAEGGGDAKPVERSRTIQLTHLHGERGQPDLGLDLGGAKAAVFALAGFDPDVLGGWFYFSYPAVPTVLLPEAGSNTHRLTAGSARDWFFHVPEGTERFTVAMKTLRAREHIKLQVVAPDRVAAILHGHEGEAVIEVPENLDGMLWRLRPDIASSTVLVDEPGEPGRWHSVPFDVTLQDVPPQLAPTWGQWFELDAHAAPAPSPDGG